MKIFSLILILTVSQSAQADSVSTIDELVSLYNYEKCTECHDDIAPDWEKSLHAKSFINKKFLKLIKDNLDKSANMNNRNMIKECLYCHAPQGNHASDELLDIIAGLVISALDDKNRIEREMAKNQLAKLNINCRICHMMKGMPQGEVKPAIIYGPGWDEHENSHQEEFGYDTVKSDYLTMSRFCLSCHRSCPSEKCFTLHKIYDEHYSDDKSKRCHDCHLQSSHSFQGVIEAVNSTDIKTLGK